MKKKHIRDCDLYGFGQNNPELIKKVLDVIKESNMNTEIKQVPILGPETSNEGFVWNGDDETRAVRKTILFQSKLGAFFALNEDKRESFNAGGAFRGSWYQHAKSISEKKWRAMRPEEVTAEMLGYRIYSQHGAFIGAIRSIHLNIDIVTLCISDGSQSKNRCLDWLCDSEWTYELNGERKRFAVEVGMIKKVKPRTEIKACQWTGDNQKEVYDFIKSILPDNTCFYLSDSDVDLSLYCYGKKDKLLPYGYWIISMGNEEFDFMQPDTFEKRYEVLNND
jgi:hypothetical protein